VRAVDFANYTPVPSPEQVRCLLGSGYTRAIVGVSFGGVARRQLEVCASGGMDIEAFCWVRWNADWRAPLDKALATVRGLPVSRLWLDCEDATSWPEAMIEARILEAEAYVRSDWRDIDTKAIYTGKWWWDAHMPTSRRFAAWDLWTAAYISGEPEGRSPAMYGGWTKAAIWQYAGTVQTCGLNTDRNLIMEDHMPTAEYDELKQRDEDIKAVVARVDAGVKFLIEVVRALAGQVYGDNDPRTLDLKQRVDAVEAGLRKLNP